VIASLRCLGIFESVFLERALEVNGLKLESGVGCLRFRPGPPRPIGRRVAGFSPFDYWRRRRVCRYRGTETQARAGSAGGESTE
jgi:hypothetical protein